MSVRTATTRTKTRHHYSALVFLLIFGLVQAAAFNTGENLLYVIAALTVSLVTFAAVLVRGMLRGLRVAREIPEAVHRNEPFFLSILIENRKRVLPSFSLQVELDGDETSLGYVPALPPRTTARVRIERRMPRRGVHPLPQTSIASGFPMGLFRRTLRFSDRRSIVVYPQVHRIQRDVLDRLDESGDRPKVADLDGDEFYALREYVPGDDIRYICWRVSARLGELVVRELEPSSARSIVLILDTRGVPETEEQDRQFEDAVELCASIAVAFLERQYAVALESPGVSLPLGQGESHVLKMLDALARVEPIPKEGFSDDGYNLSGDLGGAAKVYIATDASQWGGTGLGGSVSIPDPDEVLHATQY